VVVRSSRLTPSRGRNTPSLGPGNSAGDALTGSPAYWPSGPSACGWARQNRRGLDRRALHRISDASHSPATAPRPASGDADQTPLGHKGRDNRTIFIGSYSCQGRVVGQFEWEENPPNRIGLLSLRNPYSRVRSIEGGLCGLESVYRLSQGQPSTRSVSSNSSNGGWTGRADTTLPAL
jgi:hypothetical protein